MVKVFYAAEKISEDFPSSRYTVMPELNSQETIQIKAMPGGAMLCEATRKGSIDTDRMVFSAIGTI